MGFVVVAYDIPCDKRRTRLRKRLKDFGEPVQYSVFEFDLTSTQFKNLIKVIEAHIDKGEDRVRVYEFCGGCRENTTVMGQGPEPERNRRTLFV